MFKKPLLNLFNKIKNLFRKTPAYVATPKTPTTIPMWPKRRRANKSEPKRWTRAEWKKRKRQRQLAKANRIQNAKG